MTITLYGIPNCDTVKRARAFLAAQGAAVQFHDFKKAGVPADRLAAWVASAGWQRLLNRRPRLLPRQRLPRGSGPRLSGCTRHRSRWRRRS